MAQEKKPSKGFANKPVKADVTPQTNQSDLPVANDVIQKVEAAAVKVIHGAMDESFQVSGQKISAVRASLVEAFNIPADAIAFVDGEQVDENHILLENSTLEFVKQAGVKG